MGARLIAISHPMGLEGIKTAEDFVVFCARVSNPSNQRNTETGAKLLNYLTRNFHWSPFEMVHATIEIETTRDIGRQILRHRSFSFQEFSQRYAAVAEMPVVRELRLQDSANRQSSLPTDDEALTEWWNKQHQLVASLARNIYNAALSFGIAKEVARVILPEGMTPTRLYMAGTIRSWIHYVQLRTGNGTQKEHMEIALQCRDELLRVMPSLEEILNETKDHK